MADNNIDPELIRELSEKYESMRDAMASMIPALVLSTASINQMLAASKGLAVSEKEGKEVVDALIESFKNTAKAADTETKEKNNSTKQWRNLETSLNNAGATLKAFGSSLINTTNSMSKYQSTVSAGAKGITDLVGSFLPPNASIKIKLLFKGFTAVIDVLSFFVGNVFKQNDAMIKSYDSLSEVGATSALTTNDIRKLGQNAGYTSENLDKFTDITKDLGSNLIAMGGSASKGVVQFSKLATVTQAQRDGFNNLGISQEQYTKLQATYIRQQTAAGMIITKSTEGQRKEANKYIDSLVELAALTGISVQKQQEALDIANADENFNQYKANQSMKREALLEQAANEQDQTRKKQLTAQADAIKATIDQKDAYAKVAVSTMSAANAAAVLQSISTDGATVYTESNAKLLMAGIDVAKHNREMNAGRSQEVELLEGQVKATRRFSKMFGNAASAFGESSKELQKDFGVDNKMRETAAQFDKLKTEEGKKQFLAQRKLNADEIAAKKAGLGPKDAAKDAQNAQLATELAFRKGLDELTAIISGPVTGGFTLLMKATMSLGKTFANLSHMFGGPDIRHLFKTPEELKKDVEDLTKQASKLESALAKEVSLREAKIKNDEESNKKDKEYQEAKNKLNDIAKNRPTASSSAKDIESWQTQRVEQDKLVKKLEAERSVLINKGYQMKRELESRGMGPGAGTAYADKIRGDLEKTRAELEQAKKYATDAGAAIAPPATTSAPTPPATGAPTPAAPTGPKTVKELERDQARATASNNLGTKVAGREDDILKKINLKGGQGGQAVQGGKADAKLLDIAEKINEILPEGTFTALNDKFHQTRKDENGNLIPSKHREGKALDFVLKNPPKDIDEANSIKRQIEDLGASKVLDEYNFPSKGSTGKHFHVEVMKDGGIIKSQPGGTLVQAAEAGMNEAFVPLPKGRNIPVSMPSLDRLTASNKALAEDLRLIMGDNATNNPLVDALTNKLTDKLDPEKLLINLLSKNIPGLSKVMTLNTVAGVAGSDEMSTTEKLLEVAKLLNPTVRLVSKLFDTYQTISGNEQKQFSKLFDAIAPTTIIDQKSIDKKQDQVAVADKKQIDVSITLDKTIEQTSAIPKLTDKPVDQPVVPVQKIIEKPIDQPVVPVQKIVDKPVDQPIVPVPKLTDKPVDQPVVPVQKIVDKPVDQPIVPVPKLTDKPVDQPIVPVPKLTDKPVDQPIVPTQKVVEKIVDQPIVPVPKLTDKPVNQPVVPVQKIIEKPIDQPIVPVQKIIEKPIDNLVTPTTKVVEKTIEKSITPVPKLVDKPIEKPVNPIPKLTDKTPDLTNIQNGFDKNSYRTAVIDLADIFKTKAPTAIPDVNGLIKSQLEQQQTSQQDLITKLSTAINPTVAPTPRNDSTQEMVEMLANKLDTVINKLDTGNDLQEDFNKQSMI
jgi:hypothetical protein